jgi:thioredoxin 1
MPPKALSAPFKPLISTPGIPFASYKPMGTIHLTAQEFRNRIFDYEKEQEWNYKGELPAIVDFYAEWCGPCKAIAPILEELSIEYTDRLQIFKIDTDKEAELSSLFGIQSIPTLLFIPLGGSLMMQKGALPKNVLRQVIEERLLVAQEPGNS